MIKHYQRPMLITLVIFTALLVIWLFISNWYQSRLLADTQTEVSAQVTTHGNHISTSVSQKLAMLDSLVTFIQLHIGEEGLEHEFNQFAQSIVISESNIRAVQVFSVSGTAFVFPLEGNEAIIGRSFSTLMNDERPYVREAVHRAIETRQVTLNDPYPLRQGGLGLVARKAIYVGDQLWGLAIIIIDVPPMLQQAGFDQESSDLMLAISDTSGQVFAGEASVSDQSPVTSRIVLPDGEWTIAGYPKGGWQDRIWLRWIMFEIATGTLLLLLSALTFILAAYQTSLRLTIEQQTKELQKELRENQAAVAALRESEEKFRSLAENSQDYIMRYDRELRHTYMNPAGLAVSGIREEDIIGKTHRECGYDEILSDLWEHSIEQVFQTGQSYRTEFEWESANGPVYLDWRLSPEFDETGQVRSVLGVSRDITHQKKLEHALREDEEYLSLVYKNSDIGIFVVDVSETGEYRYQGINPMHEKLIGLGNEIVAGKTPDELVPYFGQDNMEYVKRLYDTCVNSRETIESEFLMPEGLAQGWWFTRLSPLIDDKTGRVIKLMGSGMMITERKRAEAQLKESEEHFRLLIEHAPEGIFVQTHSRFAYLNPTAYQWFGAENAEQLLGCPVIERFAPNYRAVVEDRIRQLNVLEEKVPLIEEVCLRLDGSHFDVEVVAVPIRWEGESGALVYFRDVTERTHTQERIRLQGAALEAAANAIVITDRDGRIEWVNPSFTTLTGYSADEAVGQNPRELVRSGAHDVSFYKDIWDTILAGKVWRGELINRRKDGSLFTEEQTITPLVNAQGEVARFIAIKQDISERKKTQAELIQSQQALMQSHAMTQLSLQRLRVLHDIEMTITSQMELDAMIDTIIEHVSQLGTLTAGALFVSSTPDSSLFLAGTAGFPTDIQDVHLQLPEVFQSPSVAQSFQAVYLYAINSSEMDCCVDERLKNDYHSCVILPLRITDQLKGALLLVSQQRVTFDPGWYDFLKSLALQIALVLDRYALFQRMEQTNEKLSQAYEATLEGWSRALELRERETAGHSQRVVRMTMTLAQEFGIDGDEIQAIRRGALLHDIGKMGIPDHILLKPGPLDEDEWKMMRMHPEYAYRLLADIPYLANSLEIPYCHHEKWDGSGYPRGLRGEDIPLAARIFAIVDVWDALLADRPYRKGWSQSRIRGHLLELSGTHFDPQVVEAFLKLLRERPSFGTGGLPFIPAGE